MLYNVYRPKRFQDVVGQGSEIHVLKGMIEKDWIPPALMFTGGFGTGKTTLARLVARSILCGQKNGVEPCGVCESCISIDKEQHPAYTEVDAASHGQVAEIRNLKDEASYKVIGSNRRILCLDESHMISAAGQNTMLQILEEGRTGLLFIFATTDAEKMLPTIRSRCVELKLKLLTPAEVYERLKAVALLEKYTFEDKALRIMATYVRGHLRDALVLLEQMAKTGEISEATVRLYLRLDKHQDVYNLLTTTDKAAATSQLESLLCNYSMSELQQSVGQVLVDTYKMNLGVGDFTQVDKAWMEKVTIAQGIDNLLPKAEKILSLNTDLGTLPLGMAAFGRVLWEGGQNSGAATTTPRVSSLTPGSGTAMPFRKPGR